MPRITIKIAQESTWRRWIRGITESFGSRLCLVMLWLSVFVRSIAEYPERGWISIVIGGASLVVALVIALDIVLDWVRK